MKISTAQANKLIDLLLRGVREGNRIEARMSEALHDLQNDVVMANNQLEVGNSTASYIVKLGDRVLSIGQYKLGELRGCVNRDTDHSGEELARMVQDILEAPQIRTSLAYEEERIVVKWTDQDGNENTLTAQSELRGHVARSLLNGAELSDIRPAAIAAGIMLQRAIKLNRQLDTTMDAALGNQSVGV